MTLPLLPAQVHIWGEASGSFRTFCVWCQTCGVFRAPSLLAVLVAVLGSYDAFFRKKEKTKLAPARSPEKAVHVHVPLNSRSRSISEAVTNAVCSVSDDKKADAQVL